MKQAGNLLGEAQALNGMAYTLECMGSISQACETIESVSVPCTLYPERLY